jgi:hypothetical protein
MTGVLEWSAYLMLVLLAAWALFEGRSYLVRRSIATITPEDLRSRMTAGDHPTIVDLRDWRDVLKSGEKLPGAQVLTAADVARRVKDGTVAGELILYCG